MPLSRGSEDERRACRVPWRFPTLALLALGAACGSSRDGEPAREEPPSSALDTETQIDRAAAEPSARDAAPSEPSDSEQPALEPEADAPTPDAEARAADDPAAPRVELPLALCEKYFSQASPLPTISAATAAFWTEENCAIAGLFGSVDATVDFLNYLRDWSLLILGCEPARDVPGGVSRFGPAWPLGDAPLARADVDALIEHFMDTLTAELPLDMEDETLLREALGEAGAAVSRCEACAPRLDRCAGEAPSAAHTGGG